MSVKRTRSYHSPKRTEQATTTRLRILTAAETLFERRGYEAVTLEQIAREAGISLATIYLHYQGKPAIVEAMADAIVAMDDLSVENVEGEPDPILQLQIGVGIIRRLNERSWLAADILRTAHASNPELARIWEVWQQRHLEAITRAIQAVQLLGALRPGTSVDEVVDAFYALTGTDVYRALVRERGWSPDHYEEWLYRLGCLEILGVSVG